MFVVCADGERRHTNPCCTFHTNNFVAETQVQKQWSNDARRADVGLMQLWSGGCDGSHFHLGVLETSCPSHAMLPCLEGSTPVSYQASACLKGTLELSECWCLAEYQMEQVEFLLFSFLCTKRKNSPLNTDRVGLSGCSSLGVYLQSK